MISSIWITGFRTTSVEIKKISTPPDVNFDHNSKLIYESLSTNLSIIIRSLSEINDAVFKLQSSFSEQQLHALDGINQQLTNMNGKMQDLNESIDVRHNKFRK